jgi:hypothetical protein
MSDHYDDQPAGQEELFGEMRTRSSLDELLNESRMYKSSKDYKDLLDFVIRLRNFAPFNAMLLHMQKPTLRYAATLRDWRDRYGRTPKAGARPLITLRPFGPVSLVYEYKDTEGAPLPPDLDSFVASGNVTERDLERYKQQLYRKAIRVVYESAHDQSAGWIRRDIQPKSDGTSIRYLMMINRNHPPPVQFVTLAHELGHLTLGHLGQDPDLNVPVRPRRSRAMLEIEAESVAYLVCERNGVESRSHPYLSDYVDADTTIDTLDVYQIMLAAGRVESMLGLTTVRDVMEELR